MWNTVDPLADHPVQLGFSPYSYAWNNPVNVTDPSGLCPECPKTGENGETYTSSGGATYTRNNGDWERNSGTLGEVTVTASGNNSYMATAGGGWSSMSSATASNLFSGTVPAPNSSNYKEYTQYTAERFFSQPRGLDSDHTIESLVIPLFKPVGWAFSKLFGSIAIKSGGSVLRHYTNEAGYKAIMESGELLPSVGVKNARYGSGQYLTDLMSEDLTSGQVSRRLFGVPWNGNKVTHFIDINVGGLNTLKNAPSNYLVPGTNSLPLNGRIVNHGVSIFK